MSHLLYISLRKIRKYFLKFLFYGTGIFTKMPEMGKTEKNKTDVFVSVINPRQIVLLKIVVFF